MEAKLKCLYVSSMYLILELHGLNLELIEHKHCSKLYTNNNCDIDYKCCWYSYNNDTFKICVVLLLLLVYGLLQ